MTVQDDERERELVRLFNLDWDPAHQRAGADALLRVAHNGAERVLEVEVKSTTTGTVSTARDVGMDHVSRWSSMLFVIGFYSSDARRPELLRCLCLTHDDTKPWVDSIREKVEIDCRLAERSAAAIGEADLDALMGEFAVYPLAAAKRVLRQQWTAQQYAQAADAKLDGLPAMSRSGMLEVLRRRALYIAKRGSTLNNPHIPQSFLRRFEGTDRVISGDWAHRVRVLAKNWLAAGR